MVFRINCFEFLWPEPSSHNRAISSSTQSCWTSSLGKSSSAKDFVRPSVGPNGLEVFTYLALKQATQNFSVSCKIGEEVFGSVYKAVIPYPDKNLEVAVINLNIRYIQGVKEWATDANHIGLLEHPNLVKLVGYCAEDDENGSRCLLVHEYLPKGSLKDQLSAKSGAPLPWAMRLKIAKDAAYCLAYIQEFTTGNFKSSNVFLDDEWNVKLFYSGLSWLFRKEVAEIDGYEAPENVTSMSDVWCYGVFLCELITGKPPFDLTRPKNEQKIVEWVKPYLNSKKCIQIVDSRLAGHYYPRSAKELSKIANRCLTDKPKARPTMSKVFDSINRVVMKTPRMGTVVEIGAECGDCGCRRLCTWRL